MPGSHDPTEYTLLVLGEETVNCGSEFGSYFDHSKNKFVFSDSDA